MVDNNDVVTDEALRQRIRQLIEMPEKPPASSIERTLRHPLLALVIGFVLTGIIGASITGGIQERSDEAKREAEAREAQRAAALTTVDTLGVLLNRNYYFFGEYWDAIKQDADSNVIAARFRLFDSATAEFESRRFIDAARVEVHLGPSLRRSYEAIADSMQDLAGSFDIARGDRSTIDDISPSVDSLRAFVSSLLLEMVRSADSVARQQ